MTNPQSGLRELARRMANVESRVRAAGSSPQLANSSFEDGAIQGFSGDQQVMVIGRQWDGTYTTTVTNGPTPPTPSAPIVTDGTEGISVRWDGTFAGGLLAAPMDYLRVDIHISAVDGFTPDFSNRYGTIVPPTGGEVAFALPAGTYYVRLVCWTQAGVPSAASTQVEADSWPVEAGTDGFPPSSSPAAEVVGGYEVLSIRWTPITNADPVRYNIYVGTSPGFTKDATTLAGAGVTGSMFTLKLLPGAAPTDPNDPDPRELQYDTTYYVAIEAEDDDGAATPGAEGSAQIFKIEGGAIGYQTIIGDNILGNTITADKLSATLVLASELWAGEAPGQRVGLTPNGLQGYKSDGSLMLNFPTTPGQAALLDSDLIARSLTAVGAITMRSNDNSIDKDGILKLKNGIASPVAVPQMDIGWGVNTMTLSTSSLSVSQKTGLLGAFEFQATDVSCIESKSSGAYWVVHQIRPNGTRAWFFDYFGDPYLIGGVYFSDYVNWEIWSVIEITTSSAPKNGVYRMARWIPSGATNQYYLWSPAGLNKYSRQNGIAPPVIGSNGTDVYTAEVVSNQLTVRYFVPNGDGNNLGAPTATYTASAGYSSARPLSTVFYDAAGFDIGAARYLTAERGFTSNNQLVYTSGSAIYPGGSGGSWVSSTKDAESFEVAHVNPRCVAWNGDNFWTLGGDGVMYEHLETHWDPSVRSSTVWAQYTFFDSVGTTHETTPGPAKSFVQKRRSAVQMYAPPIPGSGGADDPDTVSMYAGLGSTQPTNSNMWWQGDSTTILWLEDIATSGSSHPPTTNTFPNTNPAKIQSDDGNMVISGAGTIKIGGKDVALGTPTVTRITASGTWAKPAGLKAAFVQCLGGSGGSGGIIAAGSGEAESGAGGSGSYNEKWYLASDLSATESVTIGAGGNAGTTSGTAGTAGGSTIFKGQTAGPGAGGGGVTDATRQAVGSSQGGAGGTATGGDMNLSGARGGNGRWIASRAILASRGGDAPFGRGGLPTLSAGSSPGSGYGAGPGGSFAAAGAIAGATGQQGIVVIWCYF